VTFVLPKRVVLTTDVPGKGVRAGDVGVVVEHYPGRPGTPPGYEVEFFAATGGTIVVVTVPETSVREATPDDILAIRSQART